MDKIRVAHLFGDCDNGGASGVADYDNGVWQHVLGVPRVPLEKNLTDAQIGRWCKNMNIDVLVCTMWGTFVAGTGKSARGIVTVKEEYPELKVIGLVDEPLMVDWCHRYGGDNYNMKQAQGYMDGIGDFDAVFTICQHEYKFYRSFNPNTFFVGLPFPDHGYSNLVFNDPHPARGDNIWIGLGVGGNAFTRWERNYGVALAAFENAVEIVRHEDPDKADRMRGLMLSWTEKSSMDILHNIKDRYPNVLIQMRTSMQDYLRYLQSCSAVISPIIRDTPGRLVGECAYFEIPLYGSDVPDIQRELWGDELTFSPWDVKGYATGVAKQVLTDLDMKDTAKSAKLKLIENYGMDISRSRFSDILKRMGWGGSWHSTDAPEVLI